MEPVVTVIIPNWNGMRWLPACLESLQKQSFKHFHTIVVDNGSSDQSLSFLHEKFPLVDVIALERNFGFAYAVNRGIHAANTPLILLLNNDTVMEPSCLEYLVAHLTGEPRDVAAVSALLLSMDNPELVDDAGDLLTWYGEALKFGHLQSRSSVSIPTNILSPCAGGTLYRMEFFDVCGYFDETFFAYLEDVDLGIRGRLFGYRYMLEDKAIIYHKSHGSSIFYRYYIRLVTANRLSIFVKNIPIRPLFMNLGRILYGQLYFLLAYGRLGASLYGYWLFLKRLPEDLRARKIYMKQNRLDNRSWNQILSAVKPEPGIRHHLGKLKKKLLRLLPSLLLY